MKVLYLASGEDKLNYQNVIYQDKFIKRDLGNCMLETSLKGFYIIVASPPCNYWSRANYRRETSKYSQETKHLLPDTIKKLIENGKPFIVENVRNKPLLEKNNLIDIKGVNVYYLGRHTYWSNIDINDLINKVELPDKENIQNKTGSDRQGGEDITQLFNLFINKIKERGKINV